MVRVLSSKSQNQPGLRIEHCKRYPPLRYIGKKLRPQVATVFDFCDDTTIIPQYYHRNK